MRRLAKVLVAAALVVVLMATTVSPAYAIGWGNDGRNGGCEYGPSTSSTLHAEGWYWGKCKYFDYNK